MTLNRALKLISKTLRKRFASDRSRQRIDMAGQRRRRQHRERSSFRVRRCSRNSPRSFGWLRKTGTFDSLCCETFRPSRAAHCLYIFAVMTDQRAQISLGDEVYFTEMLRDSKGGPVDLLIETPGGYTDPTEKIASLLRTLAPDLRVIVPCRAKVTVRCWRS